MKSLKKKHMILALLCLVFAMALPMHVQAAPKVKLSKSKMTLVVGKQKTLKVKNTTERVTWSSSKKSVAKVSAKGVVTAKRAGMATITAKVGKKKYTCIVTVKEKPSLEKNKTICVGQKEKLKVEGTAQKVKWSCSDQRIVKVDKKGRIQGKKKGTAVITAQVGDKLLHCKVTVKDAITAVNKTVRIKDAGFVLVSHLSDSISCKIADPRIAEIAVTETEITGEEDEEDEPGKETSVVVYAKKSGTTYITVRNDCNNKTVKIKVIVQKTSPVLSKDKVKAYVIDHGNIDGECNKVVSKELPAYRAKASITYDYWEKDLAYEYEETKDGTAVKWMLLGTGDPKSGTYIVMWITPKGETESQYITAEVDLSTYKGENLVYEQGWYRIPADDQLQSIANEVTPRAYQAMDELLEPVGGKFGEMFQ